MVLMFQMGSVGKVVVRVLLCGEVEVSFIMCLCGSQATDRHVPLYTGQSYLVKCFLVRAFLVRLWSLQKRVCRFLPILFFMFLYSNTLLYTIIHLVFSD